MWGYIYKTTNLVNGKIYIGQHARAKFTQKYKGSGTLIRGAFIKYGISNFKVELIERCKDQKTLDEREEYWIGFYNSRNPDIGYNQSIGGRDNDKHAQEMFRKDDEARELREVVNNNDPKVKRARRLNDPANWIVIYKDGRQREVFIDKLDLYLKAGWKVEN